MYKSKDNLLNDLIECEIEIRRLQSIADSLREKIFAKSLSANGNRKLSIKAEKLIAEGQENKPKRSITPKMLKAMRKNATLARKALAAKYAKQQ